MAYQIDIDRYSMPLAATSSSCVESFRRPWHTQKPKAVRKLTNHSRERSAILNCDWPIHLLLTLLLTYSYCLTFLYVPWA